MSKSLKSSIGKAARQVNSAVKTASIRAVNNAVVSTNSKLTKELKEDLGLPLKEFKRRIRMQKASKKKSVGSVGIATKVGIPIDAYKPKEKKIKLPGLRVRKKKVFRDGRIQYVAGKGRPKSRTYYGVTAKLPRAARQLVPGGFLRTVASGKAMVLARKASLDRKGAYVNRKADRLPVVRMRFDVVRGSAKARKPEAQRHMKEVFDKTLSHEIKFAMSKAKAK